MSLNRDDLDWIMSHIGSIEEHLKKIKSYIGKEEDILIVKDAERCTMMLGFSDSTKRERCSNKAHPRGRGHCKECMGWEDWMD